MSGFRRLGSARGIDSLSDLLKDSQNCDANKPDSKVSGPDSLSPVSPLCTTRPALAASPSRSGQGTNIVSAPTSIAATSSSSSSSGSGSGWVGRSPPVVRSHSDDRSVGGSRRPGHSRSNSSGSIGFLPTGGGSSSISISTSIISISTSISTGGGGSVSSPPPVNVLPAGNIIPSGRIPRSGLTREPQKRDVLGSGRGNYGHGSIMRGVGCGSSPGGSGVSCGGWESEEWNRAGDEAFEKGNYPEALRSFDRAIAAAPETAAYRVNRATALGKMGRAGEAVEECDAALKFDCHCSKTHHLMGLSLIRLGQVEIARKHLSFPGVNPTEKEVQTLEAIEAHIRRCTDARKNGDWVKTQEEADAAMAAGAYHSPQLLACKAECLVKLLQIEDAEGILASMRKDNPTPNCCSDAKFFGFSSSSYPLYVRAQIDLAFGRFGDAAVLAQKAAQFEPNNPELKVLVTKVQALTRARNHGNALVDSKRLTEACAAYDEGISLDPLNSVLHCNKAACSYMLKKWEQCVDDCTNALRTRPNYTKALQRRAFSYLKLEKWVLAIQDYEILKQQAPDNQEYADGFSQVLAAWNTAREVAQEIISLKQFRSLTSMPGVFVVHFFESSADSQCKVQSSIMEVLNSRCPAITFLKVDVKKSSEISNAENVRTVPTVKIYKDGSSVKEVLKPTLDSLDEALRDYNK